MKEAQLARWIDRQKINWFSYISVRKYFYRAYPTSFLPFLWTRVHQQIISSAHFIPYLSLLEFRYPLEIHYFFSYQVFSVFFFINIPHNYTNEEYADMIFIYGFCDRNALQTMEKYGRRYPHRCIPNGHTIVAAFQYLRHTRSVRINTPLRERRPIN